MSNECLFCKIAKKEIASDIVYENEEILAFLDINPVNPGHTLVVPKKHFANIFDIDEKVYQNLHATVHFLAHKIKKATNSCGINIIQNNNSCAGQVVFHIHVHIVPRKEEDGFTHWKGAPYKNDEEKAAILQSIKNLL